jgi:hypothetical protein
MIRKTILIAIVVFSLSPVLYSQNPDYQLVAKNFGPLELLGNYINFDIYLVHTDTTRFEYAAGEYYLNFQTAVANGGVLSYLIDDDGSINLPPSLRPRNARILDNNDGTSRLILSMNSLPGPGNGFVIPHNSVGIKLMRMLLFTSAPQGMLIRIDFPDIHMVDLRLRWRESPSIPSTNILSYVNGLAVNVTNPTRHSIDSSGLRVYPVELTSFAHSVTDNTVSLKWTTASEINNSGFEVLKKHSALDYWSTIGFVKGNGTTNEQSSYLFKDKVNSGRYNYRLKQLDYNGNFEYFDLNSEVIIGTPPKYEMSQNYPNPFNPATKITYQIPSSDDVKLIIYDNAGREVIVLVNGFQEAGYYTVDFNASNLSSGVFYCKLESGSFAATRKLVLLK